MKETIHKPDFQFFGRTFCSSDDIRSFLSVRISVLLSITGFIYTGVFTVIGNPSLAVPGFFISISLVFCIFFFKKKYVFLGKLWLIFCTNVAIFYFSIVLTQSAGIHNFFFAVASLPFVIFSVKESGSFLVGVLLPIVGYFLLKIESVGQLFSIQKISSQALILTNNLTAFMTFVIVCVAIYAFSFSVDQILNKLFDLVGSLDMSNEALKLKNVENQGLIEENKKQIEWLGNSLSIQGKLFADLKLETDEKKKALEFAESEKEQKEAALEREKGYVVELEVKSKKLDQSLVIVEDVIKAGKLQQAIQPKEKPKSVALVFKNYAARHLAGDFGYWKDCGAKTLVVMGDVQGKGAEAGFAAGIVADRLSVFVEQQGEGISLEALDTFFRVNIAEHPITRRKAVAVVAVLVDTCDWTLRYLNAGIHTEPILCRKEFGCVQLGCSGPAYGMVDEALAVEVFEIAKGDRFLCMTDGVEDLKNDVGEAFGQARAQVFSEGLTGLLFEEVLLRMDTEIYGFKGNADFVDDISIVVMDVVGH